MLTKLAKFPRPADKGATEFTAIEVSSSSLTLAEVRVKSNAIHIENIATKPLACMVNLDSFNLHQIMVANVAAYDGFASSQCVGRRYTGGGPHGMTQYQDLRSHQTHSVKNYHRLCFVGAVYQRKSISASAWSIDGCWRVHR